MSRGQEARHVYWIALLGPDLAQQVGNADSTIEATVDVTEVAGSLIFAVSKDIEESLNPSFSGQPRSLRELPRPCLIQNPYA
jgi:hypothetical protein